MLKVMLSLSIICMCAFKLLILIRRITLSKEINAILDRVLKKKDFSVVTCFVIKTFS